MTQVGVTGSPLYLSFLVELSLVFAGPGRHSGVENLLTSTKQGRTPLFMILGWRGSLGIEPIPPAPGHSAAHAEAAAGQRRPPRSRRKIPHHSPTTQFALEDLVEKRPNSRARPYLKMVCSVLGFLGQ